MNMDTDSVPVFGAAYSRPIDAAALFTLKTFSTRGWGLIHIVGFDLAAMECLAAQISSFYRCQPIDLNTHAPVFNPSANPFGNIGWADRALAALRTEAAISRTVTVTQCLLASMRATRGHAECVGHHHFSKPDMLWLVTRDGKIKLLKQPHQEIMDTTQAYQEALRVIDELRAQGIEVETSPSKSRDNAETVAKYTGPDRVPPDKWVNVSLRPATDEQAAAVREKEDHLHSLGISFDTGGGMGVRDWSLDWSFNFKKGLL